MEDEYSWKDLNMHLLARLARAGPTDLYWLGLQNVCECILNGVY